MFLVLRLYLDNGATQRIL